MTIEQRILSILRECAWPMVRDNPWGVFADRLDQAIKREAARSAGGGSEVSSVSGTPCWCWFNWVHPQCPAHGAPAPAATTPCEHPLFAFEIRRGKRWCTQCNEPIPETPGPSQPVSAETREQKIDGLNSFARPAEPEMVEVQGVEVTRHLLRRIVDAAWNEATESETVPTTCRADRIINRVLTEPERAAGGEGGQSEADQAQTGPSLSGVPQGKPAVALGAPPVPAPLPDASQVPPMRMLKDAEENFLERESVLPMSAVDRIGLACSHGRDPTLCGQCAIEAVVADQQARRPAAPPVQGEVTQ